MVTLHEVITFLVSMQISISSLQTHNVNRCGRSRHLARKLSLRRKRSSPNVFEMAATETITDRKSGSAGMPRPISYAVFCLKKKTEGFLLRSLIMVKTFISSNNANFFYDMLFLPSSTTATSTQAL